MFLTLSCQFQEYAANLPGNYDDFSVSVANLPEYVANLPESVANLPGWKSLKLTSESMFFRFWWVTT